MCGLAGIIGSDENNSLSIKKMCDVIQHRGPDDAGYAIFQGKNLDPRLFGDQDTPRTVYDARLTYSPTLPINNNTLTDIRVVLGHRRLSIVDLSALGHQPMCSIDGRYWISYNGEVYNYIELRVELEGKGHKFLSNSDTEVILAAYAEWGAECLARFNGMWGLAILDRQRHTLFLARDRFGVKPLYYWISPRGFLTFASEIKQFTVLPGWHARINGQRAYDYLVWFPTDHTDETLFDRVYQLPPGASAMLDINSWQEGVSADGRISLRQWYHLKAEDFNGDFHEAIDEFRRLFTDAVRIRLRADVSVGFALSGGVDSSSVVCVANQLLGQQGSGAVPKTFSMCADDEILNERRWADMVVAATHADATYISPSSEGLFDVLPSMTWHQDEPFGSPAVSAQWCVFREASAAAIKVLLGGHGSDEPLAGYPPFYTPMFTSLARRGKFLTILQEALALRQLYGYGLLFAPRLLLKSILPMASIQALKRAIGKDQSRPSWINFDRLNATPHDPFLKVRAHGNQSIPELSRNLLTIAPSPMVLHYEDRNSMAHSFETRMPFLDYRLIEFALGLPDEFKLKRGIHKRVLRESMAGTLPDATRARIDKIGMGTPNATWLTRDNPDLFSKKLDEAIEAGQGALTPHCHDYLRAVISGKKPFDQVLWRMLNFGEWMKIFEVKV